MRSPRFYATLVLGASLALGALLPAPASATSSGCVHSHGLPTSSCIRVKGSSTLVDGIISSVRLTMRSSSRGYHEIWGVGFRRKSTVRTYTNESYWHTQRYSRHFTINKHLPVGSRVCARWVAWEDSAYEPRPAACKTIQA